MHGVGSLFVQCFKEVEYEKALGQLVLSTHELEVLELLSGTELIKFPRPFELFYMQGNWTCWRHEYDFECSKQSAGWKVSKGLQNVEV